MTLTTQQAANGQGRAHRRHMPGSSSSSSSGHGADGIYDRDYLQQVYTSTIHYSTVHCMTSLQNQWCTQVKLQPTARRC
jgi:hypothetical protein